MAISPAATAWRHSSALRAVVQSFCVENEAGFDFVLLTIFILLSESLLQVSSKYFLNVFFFDIVGKSKLTSHEIFNNR